MGLRNWIKEHLWGEKPKLTDLVQDSEFGRNACFTANFTLLRANSAMAQFLTDCLEEVEKQNFRKDQLFQYLMDGIAILEQNHRSIRVKLQVVRQIVSFRAKEWNLHPIPEAIDSVARGVIAHYFVEVLIEDGILLTED